MPPVPTIADAASAVTIIKTAYDISKDVWGKSASIKFGKTDVTPVFDLVANLYESVSYDIALSVIQTTIDRLAIDTERLSVDGRSFWYLLTFDYDEGIAAIEDSYFDGLPFSDSTSSEIEGYVASAYVSAFRIYVYPEKQTDKLEDVCKSAFDLLQSIISSLRDSDTLRINKTTRWAMFRTTNENSDLLYSRFLKKLKSEKLPKLSHRLERIRDGKTTISVQFDEYSLVQTFLEASKGSWPLR